LAEGEQQPKGLVRPSNLVLLAPLPPEDKADNIAGGRKEQEEGEMEGRLSWLVGLLLHTLLSLFMAGHDMGLALEVERLWSGETLGDEVGEVAGEYTRDSDALASRNFCVSCFFSLLTRTKLFTDLMAESISSGVT